MAMTVQCTSCFTSFPVDPAKVPPGGVRARCSACGSIFRVERPSEPSEPAPRSIEPETTVDETSVEPPEPAQAVEPEAAEPSMHGVGEEATPPMIDRGDTDAERHDGMDYDLSGEDVGAQSVGGAAVDEWVVDREPEVDRSELDMERLDTIEEGLRHAQDDLVAQGEAPAAGEAPAPGAPEAGGAGTTFTPEPPAPEPGVPGEVGAPTPSAPVQGFTFGRRDPHEKASRLARVLVSDMVTYNAERHRRALDHGTLREDFDDEIKKSWQEYVDQVGRDVAESTGFFNDALNEILAEGRHVF